MDRIGWAVLLIGVGVEAIFGVLFVLWENPPLIVEAIVLAGGIVVILVGLAILIRGRSVRLTIELGQSEHPEPVIRETAILFIRGRHVEEGYGRVVEALYDVEAEIITTSLGERTMTPIFTQAWANHDIYLRWAGRKTEERHITFDDQAVIELAIDSYRNGHEVSFIAATSDHAERLYRLHPGRQYLLTIQVGARNAARPVLVYYRLSVKQSRIEAALQEERRLEVEEIDRSVIESVRRTQPWQPQ